MNRFSNGLGCHMSCESLDEFLRNWDSFKGTGRLPRVDLLGSGRDIFLNTFIKFDVPTLRSLL